MWVCASGGKSGVWGPQQTHVLLPRHPPPPGWGASDLSGKFGGFVPAAAAVRGPLVLAAGARTCHEVPRGGIRPQTNSVSHPPGWEGRELEKQQPLAFIKFPVSIPWQLSQLPLLSAPEGPTEPITPATHMGNLSMPNCPSSWGRNAQFQKGKQSEIIFPFENQSQLLIGRMPTN